MAIFGAGASNAPIQSFSLSSNGVQSRASSGLSNGPSGPSATDQILQFQDEAIAEHAAEVAEANAERLRGDGDIDIIV